MMRSGSLTSAVDFHDAAAASFAAAAGAIPAARWAEPLGEGRWSPAHLAAHLTATYDVLLRELRGGEGMRVKTNFVTRLILRVTIVPRIMLRGAFPKHARAPRETRPPEALLPQHEAVDLFKARAKEFADAARSSSPKQKLTHAYFGRSSVAMGVRLCAHHIEHHRAQLP